MALLIAGGAAATASAQPAPPHRICLGTPAADDVTFGIDLVWMYRVVGDDVLVLHRVQCLGHPATYRWLSSNAMAG